MKSLTPYLFFYGRCQEALNFYKDCLNGEILSLHLFDDKTCSGKPIDETWKNKVMHAEFKADDIYFMASDGMPAETKPTLVNAISLSINFVTEEEQSIVFEKFSRLGKVTMPLQDTFWGARFGMLTDQFGINWMFNCEKKQAE